MYRSDQNLHRQNRNSSSSSSSSSRVSTSYLSRQISNNTAESSRIRTQNTTNERDHFRDWKQRRNNERQTSEGKENKGGKEGDPNGVSFIIGTCPFMCPERERALRERLRDLAVFERLNGNPAKTSADLAIKKASDLRPLPVLEETLKYLLEFLDSKEHPFEVVHDFIFDRTRSIRQDLSIQNIANDRAIYLYEEMVKFHIVSHKKLQSCSGPSIASMQHLNMEQLTKALSSLYNLYDANRKKNNIHKNEAEFRSLYVLLHLDPNSQPMGGSLSLWFRRLTSAFIQSKEICFARTVLRFFRMGNYKGFLSTIASEASYLQFCIIEPHINEIRALALSCVNNVGYKLHPYPLTQLSKVLMMKESDMESFCNACGLETLTDSAGAKVLHTKQTTFSRANEGFQWHGLVGLERFESATG